MTVKGLAASASRLSPRAEDRLVAATINKLDPSFPWCSSAPTSYRAPLLLRMLTIERGKLRPMLVRLLLQEFPFHVDLGCRRAFQRGEMSERVVRIGERRLQPATSSRAAKPGTTRAAAPEPNASPQTIAVRVPVSVSLEELHQRPRSSR